MKRTVFFILMLLLLAVLTITDISCGQVFINPFGQGLSDVEQQIWFNLRLPRAITAILAGVALSLSGLMMQTLFRNPLAGPYILGVSSGAGLGVALVTMCSAFGFRAIQYSVGSFGIALAAIIGANLVLLLVMSVARKVRSNVSLLIVGMMIGSIAGALVSVVQNFANPDSLKLFIVWTLGSLSSVGWSELQVLTVIVLIGLIMSVCLIKPLNGLALGENYARGLGVKVERTRTAIVLATGLLSGGITAFCGPIAFVGVAVPHIARGILRTANHQLTVPACALVGANLLLVCDILCNLGTYTLPISTISALFGAPIIIIILTSNIKHL
ncbi:MAG: iron ABC transporter permease [Paludibacteraceae bacterium]|nr:iron ABC transporter permease [Paludibacteraceae bacterium]